MKKRPSVTTLPKTPSGIRGLDEITNGGIPRGRPTLICGPAGCGKTLMSMEFLIHGICEYDEPGVFMAFEETGRDLAENVASLGFDVPALIAARKLAIDYVHIERTEIQETGEYDLEGIFIRLDCAITKIGAKRVVLDTVEALFAGFSNPAILRAELRRLFRWLKDKGVTAIVTGERGDKTLTRYGIEEYVSDCVIVLDHRVTDQISTRRLRIAKYRGSSHGTNEYPFLIDDDGISILPVTSLRLAHKASTERISSGIPMLDAMLGGKGYFKGTSILVSGTAGSGKTSVAAHFADAACKRGERCLYLLFEESPDQLMRNMRSIGIDLQRWFKKGVLQFHAARPSLTGLETHLAVTLKTIRDFRADVVVIDPISAFAAMSDQAEIKAMLIRLVDFLKMNEITALMTSLTASAPNLGIEHTESEISSLIDTWLLLRDMEQDGERNRCMYLLKSRGMSHSNQVREFILTGDGVRLLEAYVGPAGVLTGSARLKQELRDRNQVAAEREVSARLGRDLDRKRLALSNQIELLREEMRELESESVQLSRVREEGLRQTAEDQISIGRLRHSDGPEVAAIKRPMIGRNDDTTITEKSRGENNGTSARRNVGAQAVRRGSNGKVVGRTR